MAAQDENVIVVASPDRSRSYQWIRVQPVWTPDLRHDDPVQCRFLVGWLRSGEFLSLHADVQPLPEPLAGLAVDFVDGALP